MTCLLDPRAWLAALLLAMASYGAGRWQQSRADQLDTKVAQLEAANADLEEWKQTAEDRMEIAYVATKNAESARSDARAADAVSERLRQRLASLQAGASSSPGAPADTAGDVLADVLARVDAAAGELAAYADAARIAGLACEQIEGVGGR